uniref:IP07005p n=1 Tax=Drosophila melanogaster TaxID=7227 RepID=Q4V5L8_DROME|nr:IP07005p [Drosophila melanogaster]
MWSSTISPTNSKKLLIGSTRSVDYVGDSARTAAGNIKTGAAAAAGAKGSKSKATATAPTTKISIEISSSGSIETVQDLRSDLGQFQSS